MAIRWADSADKHQVDRADILNAITNHLHWVPEFNESRRPGRPSPDLFIGPTIDRSELREVFVEITPPDNLFIFHAMPARRKILDIAERNES